MARRRGWVSAGIARAQCRRSPMPWQGLQGAYSWGDPSAHQPLREAHPQRRLRDREPAELRDEDDRQPDEECRMHAAVADRVERDAAEDHQVGEAEEDRRTELLHELERQAR